MSDNVIKLRHTVGTDNFEAAGAASENVKRTLKQLGVDAKSVRRVAIAMYEGEINMVIHANGGVAEADIYPDYVVIRLKDSGPGIADIELAMKEGFSTATEEVRNLGFGAGMGLPNMKKYSDEFAIESEVGVGTTVTMKIKFE